MLQEKIAVDRPAGKILSLQTVRALAFLGIFTSHCGVTYLGPWGASVFFVLSGFVMVFTYSDKNMDTSMRSNFQFSLKKIKKLYPLHIVMMISAIPIIIWDIMQNDSARTYVVSIIKVFLNIFLVQTWVAKSSAYFSMNGVAWYLSVCLFIYMMFPLLMKQIKRYSDDKMAYICIAVILVLQIIVGFLSSLVNVPLKYSDNFSKWITYILPVFRLGDFAIGCNLGYLFLKKRTQISSVLATILEIVTIALIYISETIYREKISFLGSEWCRYSVLFLPTSALLVYLFALNKGIISKLLTNKALIFIGNISAYTFLIHQMVIRYLKVLMPHVINGEVNIWINTVLAFIITLISTLIYRKIENDVKRKHVEK